MCKTSLFAEFERGILRERAKAGIAQAWKMASDTANHKLQQSKVKK
jgi:hypothetical protein